MRTRHLGKAVAGLAAAAATIGLLGLPASANSGTGEINQGTLTLIGAESQTVHEQDLSSDDPTTECTASSNTLSMSGGTTGTWSATLSSNTAVTIGTTPFKATLSATVGGTYDATTLTGTTGSATATLIRTTAAGSCTPLTGAGNCVITVSGLLVDGTHNVSPTPTIGVGDIATVSGGTNAEGDLGFEVAVNGTATNCASLLGADDGAVTLASVEVEVVSVP
jgi:hypothetical protein